MQNIMLDLGTMGTSINSAIVSISAVKFDQDLGIIDRFYKVINLQSSIDKGFVIDGGTVTWWLNQSEAARKELKNAKLTIKDALKAFQDWLPKDDNIQIWGNGCDFDNVILQNAFKRFNVENPWPYWSNRCFRTFKCSFPSIKTIDIGTAHKSVDDAEYQAKYLIALVERHKLKEVL